jgi:hypothetical protein
VTVVAGLRSLAKVMELPPAPNVRAPALDPTCEGLGVKFPGATRPPVTIAIVRSRYVSFKLRHPHSPQPTSVGIKHHVVISTADENALE